MIWGEEEALLNLFVSKTSPPSSRVTERIVFNPWKCRITAIACSESIFPYQTSSHWWTKQMRCPGLAGVSCLLDKRCGIALEPFDWVSRSSFKPMTQSVLNCDEVMAKVWLTLRHKSIKPFIEVMWSVITYLLFNPEIIYKGVSVFAKALALGLPTVVVPHEATCLYSKPEHVDTAVTANISLVHS